MSATPENLADQPAGVDDDDPDFRPDPADAARRVLEYVGWFGDGYIDGGLDFFPLHSRDLEVVARAVPKIVTTADELDALPLDSVVVDRHGTPRTKRAGDSYMGAGWTHAGRSPLASRELADGYSMRVAYNPKGHDL